MKNRMSKLLLAVLLTCSVVMIATGCDKLKKEPETEVQTETPTEAPTESETQTETQPPTEPPTESETEPPTEPETFAKELTVEEELQNETELDAYRTLYAMDDINIRTKPGTDGEIFDSFDQGEKIIVYGETPNWWKVDVEEYDSAGYVSKQFVSESEVEPKTEEEREQEANETAADDSQSVSGTVSEEASSTDLEYSVEMYAESFPIMASTGANMRNTPAQDGEIIQTIASGTSVTAVGYTDRWYKVDYNGTVGYVNKNLFATE